MVKVHSTSACFELRNHLLEFTDIIVSVFLLSCCYRLSALHNMLLHLLEHMVCNYIKPCLPCKWFWACSRLMILLETLSLTLFKKQNPRLFNALLLQSWNGLLEIYQLKLSSAIQLVVALFFRAHHV